MEPPPVRGSVCKLQPTTIFNDRYKDHQRATQSDGHSVWLFDEQNDLTGSCLFVSLSL